MSRQQQAEAFVLKEELPKIKDQENLFVGTLYGANLSIETSKEVLLCALSHALRERREQQERINNRFL